jgi:anti-sigma B factor antagonist
MTFRCWWPNFNEPWRPVTWERAAQSIRTGEWKGKTSMEMTLMELRDNAIKISLSGRLDTPGVDAIETKFAAAAKRKNALVDLSGVSFLASMGIRMIFSSARGLKASGCRMILLAPRELVNEVLENAGVNQIIPVVPDEQQALALLNS